MGEGGHRVSYLIPNEHLSISISWQGKRGRTMRISEAISALSSF